MASRHCPHLVVKKFSMWELPEQSAYCKLCRSEWASFTLKKEVCDRCIHRCIEETRRVKQLPPNPKITDSDLTEFILKQFQRECKGQEWHPCEALLPTGYQCGHRATRYKGRWSRRVCAAHYRQPNDFLFYIPPNGKMTEVYGMVHFLRLVGNKSSVVRRALEVLRNE